MIEWQCELYINWVVIIREIGEEAGSIRPKRLKVITIIYKYT